MYANLPSRVKWMRGLELLIGIVYEIGTVGYKYYEL